MKICNIRRGKGNRQHILYAEIRSEDGELLVAASLEYCVMWINRYIGYEEEQ